MLKGLGNLGDMAKMMKSMQDIQGRMAEAQEALDRITVTGEAGTGLVKATGLALSAAGPTIDMGGTRVTLWQGTV